MSVKAIIQLSSRELWEDATGGNLPIKYQQTRILYGHSLKSMILSNHKKNTSHQQKTNNTHNNTNKL